MDSMSLFSVLTVSVPEAICNVMIGFLIIGQKENIKPGRLNLIKMLITVFLFAAGSFLIRTLSPSGSIGMLISVPAHMLLAIMVLKFIYQISFGKSTLTTLAFMGVLITLEIFIVPPMIVYMQKNISTIYGDNILRLLCTLPERILQCCIVVSVWNLKGSLVDYQKYKKFKYIFTTILTLLYTGEMIMLFTFMSTIDKIGIVYTIGYLVPFAMFVTVNALIFVLISILTSTIEKKEREKLHDHTIKLRNIAQLINKS